jgi:hypothetical protein
MHQVTMVLPFDTPFETERNEEADRYGGQMDEDVAPAMRRFMRRMNVDHRLFLRGIRIALLAHCIVLAASG